MKNVICIWQPEQKKLETVLPLLWQAKKNLQRGSSNPITLIFLSETKGIPPIYLTKLQEVGYEVTDAAKVYQQLAKTYQELDRFGDYEKKCFLRWLVLKELYLGEKIIHYDADVVFNVSPEAIAQEVTDFTFVLQGCPAFTVINQASWLKDYAKQLHNFVKDIENYSQKAWQARKGWQHSQQTKWAGSRFRPVISSDQDLLSHLIHTDQIYQDKPQQIVRKSRLFFMENPLYPHLAFPSKVPIRYQRRLKLDYFNQQPLAFWHMQTDFMVYLNRFLRRGWLNAVSKCSNQVEEPVSETRVLNLIHNLLGKSYLSRKEIYQLFFEKSDFSSVYNQQSFWRAKTFK